MSSPFQKPRIGVAVFVVPLRPPRRKFADLIAAWPAVPGFGDQLDGAEHGILTACFQKAALVVEAVGLARKNGAQIKTEAIDFGFLDPVAQAVGDHLHHARVREIHGVTGTGIVDVVARLVGNQAVIAGVVDAFEGQRRPHLVAFGGVVVDHVKNDFEPCIVETRDHFLEFLQGGARLRGVAWFRSEETDGVVAPVVREPLVQQMPIVHEGKHREHLHRGDAQCLDVRNNLAV